MLLISLSLSHNKKWESSVKQEAYKPTASNEFIPLS